METGHIAHEVHGIGRFKLGRHGAGHAAKAVGDKLSLGHFPVPLVLLDITRYVFLFRHILHLPFLLFLHPGLCILGKQRLIAVGPCFSLKLFGRLFYKLRIVQQVDGRRCQDLSSIQESLMGNG